MESTWSLRGATEPLRKPKISTYHKTPWCQHTRTPQERAFLNSQILMAPVLSCHGCAGNRQSLGQLALPLRRRRCRLDDKRSLPKPRESPEFFLLRHPEPRGLLFHAAVVWQLLFKHCCGFLQDQALQHVRGLMTTTH